MKGSATLVASLFVASTVALTSSSSAGPRDSPYHPISNQGFSRSTKNGVRDAYTTSDKEKFAPRFDGLRFIETLVTAHR